MIVDKLLKLKTSKVFQNFIYLNFTQLINYIFPLISFSYLSRVFSQSNYGVLITAGAIASYLALVTDFGFNLSATRDLAKAGHGKEKINAIVNQVLSTKVLLYSFCFAPLVALIFISPKYNQHYLIFIVNLIGVIGGVIFPTWYFQATNTMLRIAKLNLLSRIIGILLLLLLIHRDGDLLLLSILNMLNSCFIGVLALFLIIHNDKLKIRLGFSISFFIKSLKNSFASFSLVLLISFYTLFNTILLSWFCNYKDVAIYGVADKIIGMILTVQGALIQSVFPSITAEENQSIIRQKAIRLFKYNLLLGGVMFIFINVGAPLIIYILAGHRYDSSIPVLHILSLVPLVMAFSSSISTYCFALKLEKIQVYAYLIGAVCCVASNLIFIKKYSYYAVSINYIVCETLSLGILFFLISKNKDIVRF